MSRVFTALSTSVDGYITGPDPSPEVALGRGGKPLFDWYFDGDVPSQVFEGFRLSAESARVFDHVAGRVGAVIAGRRTYDHSNGFGGDGGPHPTAPLVVLSHRPPPPGATQPFAAGIEEAVEIASRRAGDRDVGLQGGQTTAAAIEAGLLEEVIVHQVPILLGGGTPLFPQSPPVRELSRVEVVAAPGVTHLHYALAPDRRRGDKEESQW
jgi:dihydrofolate reductase